MQHIRDTSKYKSISFAGRPWPCHRPCVSRTPCHRITITGIQPHAIKQCHLHHPPVITIFIGGMFTIPSHGWFIFHCLKPTLNHDIVHLLMVKSLKNPWKSKETIMIPSVTQQLRSGGWENGCLSFDSNGTAARLEIVMIFDTLLGLWSLGGNAW